MDASDIAKHYPVLFHMAEEGSWESIQRHGLLSTASLLDLFEADDAARDGVLRQRRPESVLLEHPTHGSAVVRDQIPLSEKALAKCLTDMSLEEWLAVLNSRVFFWLDEPHLETLLGAKAYRDGAHDVIQVETAKLLELHESRITLSPINSGSTIYNARPRGSNTFLPIADYPFEERRRARGRDAIIELAVDSGVPDITEVALRVERRRPNEIEKIIWERPK